MEGNFDEHCYRSIKLKFLKPDERDYDGLLSEQNGRIGIR